MRPEARRPCLAAAATLVLALALAPVSAQPRDGGLSSAVLLPRAPRTAPASPSTEAAALGTPTSFADTRLRASGWLGDSVRLEVPRDAVTGSYARPKFVVGLQSESMRNWMNSAGLDADHCMLPMLRARTRMSAEGEVNGTLWLYARCTFR